MLASKISSGFGESMPHARPLGGSDGGGEPRWGSKSPMVGFDLRHYSHSQCTFPNPCLDVAVPVLSFPLYFPNLTCDWLHRPQARLESKSGL